MLVAAGAAAVGGVVSAATTHRDGVRNVKKEHDGEYQLRPSSKEAARASLEFQRLLGGGGALVGGALLGVQVLSGRATLPMTLAGGMLLGGGIAKVAKLAGAEAEIDPNLPERTPEGQPDMTRHNKHMYQQEGAGYNALGFYQGPRWGQSSYSPTYQQHSIDQMMPTVPGALHLGTYLGGNVRPGGPFGVPVPTGVGDVNARGLAAQERFAAEQQLLAHLSGQLARPQG